MIEENKNAAIKRYRIKPQIGRICCPGRIMLHAINRGTAHQVKGLVSLLPNDWKISCLGFHKKEYCFQMAFGTKVVPGLSFGPRNPSFEKIEALIPLIDLEKPIMHGNYALDLAIKSEDFDIVCLIAKHQKRMETKMSSASNSSRLEFTEKVAKLLLENRKREEEELNPKKKRKTVNFLIDLD